MRKLCVLLATLWLSTVAWAGTTQNTGTFDNRGRVSQRFWLEYRPDGLDPEQSYPVVVVLHPGASTPANIQNAAGWDAIADQYGLIILYPAGNEGTAPVASQWNIWDFDGAPDTILPVGVRERDDAGFLSQLIDRTVSRSQFAGNPARVYMTGFSSGAQMTSSYAGTGRNNVTAFGPVSGGWCEQCGVPESFFIPAGPVPVWYWRGEREGGLTPCSISRDIHDSAQREFWIDFNGVVQTPSLDSRLVTAVNPANGQLIQVTHVTEVFTGGLSEFRYTVVLDSGHLYQPGAARRLWEEFFSRFSAPTSCPGDFNGVDGVTTQDIFDFLQAYFSGDLAADIDQSGTIQPQDIFDFLLNWFAGCD
jgi:poly(3-hydroxybutyrate) depolymerase